MGCKAQGPEFASEWGFAARTCRSRMVWRLEGVAPAGPCSADTPRKTLPQTLLNPISVSESPRTARHQTIGAGARTECGVEASGYPLKFWIGVRATTARAE